MKKINLFIIILLSCYMFISSTSISFAADKNPTKDIQLPEGIEVIRVSREYLYENAKEMKNQWVMVAGKLTAVNGNDKDGYTVNMNGASDVRLIMCYLEDGNKDATLLKEGDYATVVGRVERKILGQVLLYDCQIPFTGDVSKKFDEDASAFFADKVKNKTKKSSVFGSQTIDKESAISITATAAWKELKDNQVACKKKYDGQVVAITGIIEDFGTNIYGQEYVILANGDKYSIGSVQCFFKNDQMDYVSTLSKGDEVTLYGMADIGSTSFKLSNSQP